MFLSTAATSICEMSSPSLFSFFVLNYCCPSLLLPVLAFVSFRIFHFHIGFVAVDFPFAKQHFAFLSLWINI